MCRKRMSYINKCMNMHTCQRLTVKSHSAVQCIVMQNVVSIKKLLQIVNRINTSFNEGKI